jgi:hypothetical protein
VGVGRWETLMGALTSSCDLQFKIIFPAIFCRRSMSSSSSVIPQAASAAVLKQSEPVPDEAVAVQGPNFDEHPTLETLLDSYERIGFQANSLSKAIKIVDKMVGAPLCL